MVWSLTSPRTKRISGLQNFRSSPEKDFFNAIGIKRTWSLRRAMSVHWVQSGSSVEALLLPGLIREAKQQLTREEAGSGT
jgi:hypothetical protein